MIPATGLPSPSGISQPRLPDLPMAANHHSGHCAGAASGATVSPDAGDLGFTGEDRIMAAPRVLLVDDNPAFLAAATRYLVDYCGAEVVGCASSGEQAIEMVRTLAPQIVLMDMTMGGISGLVAAQRIKAHADAPAVVLVTLNSGIEYQKLVDTLPIDGFVSKAEFATQIPPLLEKLGKLTD
jgi:CheY-like chemotaxis protein